MYDKKITLGNIMVDPGLAFIGAHFVPTRCHVPLEGISKQNIIHYIYFNLA